MQEEKTSEVARRNLTNLSLMMGPWSATQIEHCVNMFVSSYQQAMGIYTTAEREELEKIISEYAVMINPPMLFSSEGLSKAGNDVFGNASFRDVIIRITALFLSRLPDPHTTYRCLCEHIAWSHTLAGDGEPEDCLVPDQILERMPTLDEITTALLNNKWLLTLAMIAQYVTISRSEERAPNIPAGTRPNRA